MMEATKELTDAADLLTMLDCLTDSLSRDTTGTAVPPWAGIKLTIRQTREIILGTHEKISRQGGGYMEPMSQRQENQYMGGGLADRVQQIPPTSTGSRARDLLNNVAAAGKVTRVQAPAQNPVHNVTKTAANESNDM